MSTISRMLPGKRMFQDEISPMNFLNTPIRTRNQYKIESRGQSSMVSPFPAKRPKMTGAADFKEVAMGSIMAHY